MYVLDTLGELTAAYSLADVAFVGGTLIPHGGQSIMEPATFGRAIVVGPSMLNFPGTIDEFLSVGGIVQISATDADKPAQIRQLTDAFRSLLTDTDKRERTGRAAPVRVPIQSGRDRVHGGAHRVRAGRTGHSSAGGIKPPAHGRIDSSFGLRRGDTAFSLARRATYL